MRREIGTKGQKTGSQHFYKGHIRRNKAISACGLGKNCFGSSYFYSIYPARILCTSLVVEYPCTNGSARACPPQVFISAVSGSLSMS